MALDGTVIRALVEELQLLVGARINKIYQPVEHDLVFHIRQVGQNQKLLLSANPTYPRVHLTSQTFINPVEAPNFCMLLRKHLENGTIERIVQVDMERIIHIDVRHRNEMGDLETKRIVVELMGRHSNIILMNPENLIIYGAIKHVTAAISTHRVVLPGALYAPPPEQQKQNLLQIDEKQWKTLLNKAMLEPDFSLEHFIVRTFMGISPLVARELVYRSQTNDQTIDESVFQFKKNLQLHNYEPSIVENVTEQKTYFSAVKLTHLSQHQTRQYAQISTCLEEYYGNKAERDAVKQKVGDLLRLLQNERKKNKRKLVILQQTITDARKNEQYKLQGELLTAFLHQVERGDDKITVTNYYSEEQEFISIPLDPKLSPADNAQAYFKRYNKAKNSIPIVEEQIEQTKAELSYIENILQQLEYAGIQDIDEIREELMEQGYLKKRKKAKKKKQRNKPMLTKYVSSEGISIYVGKNNIQNDYVTNRLGKATDTWLHTKDIPGAHVVIQSAEFNEQTLHEAAQLAAYFSKGKNSSQVPVDYTFIRHVRKPNGAKPGYVIYDQQKTIFVTPDEKIIDTLHSETY